MSSLLTGAVLVVATAAIVLVLFLTAGRRKGRRPERHERRRAEVTAAAPRAVQIDGGPRRPCPVCRALLSSGERVSSVVRLSPTGERLMEISGCPRCRPPSSRPRTCPVCGASLVPTDVLLATITDRSKEGRKPHVHVRGCSQCRR